MDEVRAGSAATSPVTCTLEASFEEDLTRWLARLYAVRAERRLMRRIERILVVGWLAVIAATMAVPIAGALAAAVALFAMLGATWRAAVGSLAGASCFDRAVAHGPTTSSEVPTFGYDERTRLVRLMNLSCAAWRPATRMLLRAEWREARSCGQLAQWGAMDDLEDVVLANASADWTTSN